MSWFQVFFGNEVMVCSPTVSFRFKPLVVAAVEAVSAAEAVAAPVVIIIAIIVIIIINTTS